MLEVCTHVAITSQLTMGNVPERCLNYSYLIGHKSALQFHLGHHAKEVSRTQDVRELHTVPVCLRCLSTSCFQGGSLSQHAQVICPALLALHAPIFLQKGGVAVPDTTCVPSLLQDVLLITAVIVCMQSADSISNNPLLVYCNGNCGWTHTVERSCSTPVQ